MGRSRYRKFAFIIYMAVLCTGLLLLIPRASVAKERANILILHSYHQGYDWTDNITQGILAAIEADKQHQANIYVEYMDTKRYDFKTMMPSLVTIYRHKYQNRKLDVIIACDDNALTLLLENHDTLFTGVPVVFCGVNNQILSDKAAKQGYTGVLDNKDIRGTIDTALRLLPSLKTIAVISDRTTTGQVLFNQYRSIAGSFTNKIDFQELVGLTQVELTTRLRDLPEHSAVLLLSLFRTSRQDAIDMQAAIGLIKENTPAPIFILNDVYLGKGVVGGSVVSGRTQGVKAVELARLVLDGVPTQDIPLIAKEATIPMFDYTIMQEEGISQRNLPGGSVLINKPFSLYDEYAPYIWAIIVIIVVQGMTIALLVVIHLKKRRVESALRDSENRYRTIFETANEGIWVGDKDQITTMVNDIFAKMLGYTENEIVGRPIVDFMHKDEQNDHYAQMSKRRSGVDSQYERRFVTKDGETIWCQVSAKGVINEQGTFEGSFSMISDISDRKLFEKRLLKAKEKAEEANMAKDEFLANMSHELRTPLNGILGMLQLLQGTEQSTEQKEYTGNAITASRRLTHLLSDLLDISRIEARKMEIHRDVFKMRNTLTGVMELFHTAIDEKGLDVSLFVDEAIPYELFGDSTRLQQIIINLVGNAIKFTDDGYVKVEALRLPKPNSDKENILFIVSDSGCGIPDDKQSAVFESFTQAEGTYTRQHQGAGLGLHIVKRLTLLMQGTLTMTSEVGKGTSFYVSLPFEPATGPAEDMEPPISTDGTIEYKRALVVEDDRVNRLSLTRQLEKIGLEVGIAEDGVMALEAIEKNDYDIIFMDIQMPNMDGLEATRKLRTEARYAQYAALPIIAITAYSMEGDREKFMQAGMDDYVPKPFETEDLKKVLSIKRK